jgi:hypothetical protein
LILFSLWHVAIPLRFSLQGEDGVMWKWLAIGVAGSVVGYVAVYFALDGKPAPEPRPEPPAAVPAEPVVLTQVVDVTDLDPLLDPPPRPSAGVPFEPAEPPGSITPVGAPAPIPPAGD